MKFIKNILWIIFLSGTSVAAQTANDSTKTKSYSLYTYPYAFYTPETRFAFGGGTILSFFTSKEHGLRPSKILLGGYYTTNKNFLISIHPKIYFTTTFFEPRIFFENVVDKFYGIGNNTVEIDNASYSARRYGLELTFRKTILKKYQIGLTGEVSNWHIVDRKDNPFLQDNSVSGSKGGIVSGAGVLIGYDKRNYGYLPTKGSFHIFKVTFFNNIFGSDYNFTRYILDLREYFTIVKDWVISAIQVYGSAVTGNPPFYYLPALGGSERMRGYYEGRYRDKYYFTSQVEFSFSDPWVNRTGFTVFAAIGDVSNAISHFHLPQFKVSYGFGVVYLLDPDNRTILRADLGFGRGTSGLYFAAGMAF